MTIPKELIQKAISILEEKAKEEKLITYSQIYSELGLDIDDKEDRNMGGYVLGGVNDESMKYNMLLSALVVTEEEGIPREGFFDFAAALGRIDKDAGRKEQINFWIKEVFQIFKRHN